MSEKKTIDDNEKEVFKNSVKITKELLYVATNKRKLVPDLDYYIYVKLLNGRERRLFYKLMAEDKTKDANGVPVTMMPVLIALCATDEEGQNIFSIDDIKDIDEKIPSNIQEQIFTTAASFNGMTERSVDDAVKN